MLSTRSNLQAPLQVDILQTSFDAFMAARRQEAVARAASLKFPTSSSLADAKLLSRAHADPGLSRTRVSAPTSQYTEPAAASRHNREPIHRSSGKRHQSPPPEEQFVVHDSSVAPKTTTPPAAQPVFSSQSAEPTRIPQHARNSLRALLQGYRVRFILHSPYGKSLQQQISDVQREIDERGKGDAADGDEWIRKLRKERSVHVEALAQLIETAPLKRPKTVLC